MLRITLAATLFATCAALPTARADEVEVPLKDVPQKVLAALKKQFPAGKIESATKETDAGETTFTVSLKSAGSNYDVTLSPDGTITEIAREVAFNALPKPVVAAVQKLYPKAKVESAYEVTEPGVKGKTFHLELTTAGGKELDVVFDPTGKVISEE